MKHLKLACGINSDFCAQTVTYLPCVYLACVAGGVSRASAFVLVPKPLTRVAKPLEDW